MPRSRARQVRGRGLQRAAWFGLAFLVASHLSQVRQARAGIYKYVDQEGVVHFSNVPTSPRYVLYLKEDGDIEFHYSDKDRFDYLIEEASRQYGVDFALIKAIIRAESDFDPQAVSRTGAMGLMQLMPTTAENLSVIDAFDPRENIDAGVRYFRRLLRTFGNDLELSLAAYNAGKNAVLQFNSVPPYEETRRFVKKVLHFYRIYNR
ncbi:MAG: transglycosylase SLT domain-containing protein [Deltaproteobacteria bacterium]|nr:transglycosylase SLT domain-containing protein [Deltaproteobacteria bacterium]